MKTIFVIYTNKKLTDKEIGYTKRYCFNTKDDVKVGDMIKSPNYDTAMQVVQVLEEAFSHFNHATGDLSNSLTNTKQFLIRELCIREEDTSVIYGKILNT